MDYNKDIKRDYKYLGLWGLMVYVLMLHFLYTGVVSPRKMAI